MLLYESHAYRQTWTAFGIMIGYVSGLIFFRVPDKPNITGLNWRLMMASVCDPPVYRNNMYAHKFVNSRPVSLLFSSWFKYSSAPNHRVGTCRKAATTRHTTRSVDSVTNRSRLHETCTVRFATKSDSLIVTNLCVRRHPCPSRSRTRNQPRQEQILRAIRRSP